MNKPKIVVTDRALDETIETLVAFETSHCVSHAHAFLNSLLDDR